MSGGVLLYDVSDGVATLTLNRPDKRNALNAELVDALKAGLSEAAADGAVRVVAITGAGRDFCSGADLAELDRISQMSEEESTRGRWWRWYTGVLSRVGAGSRPLVIWCWRRRTPSWAIRRYTSASFQRS
jgi:enoyl-CoA hydratase/carnithine racemase